MTTTNEQVDIDAALAQVSTERLMDALSERIGMPLARLKMPAWATEFDPADGSVTVYSRASDVAVFEMVANGRAGAGPKHTPGMYQCFGEDGYTSPVHISSLSTDEMFTVPEIRKLIAALTELCDIAEGVAS